MNIHHSRSRFLLILAIVLAVPVLAACSNEQAFDLASQSELPATMLEAPPTVREAYRFAIANPHELEKYPCYCGCGAMGHMSNRSCYISSYGEDGVTAFDDHALGCGICVDITQDVMRQMNEGKTDREIRAYIDATYSAFGPSTDTPLP